MTILKGVTKVKTIGAVTISHVNDKFNLMLKSQHVTIQITYPWAIRNSVPDRSVDHSPFARPMTPQASLPPALPVLRPVTYNWIVRMGDFHVSSGLENIREVKSDLD